MLWILSAEDILQIFTAQKNSFSKMDRSQLERHFGPKTLSWKQHKYPGQCWYMRTLSIWRSLLCWPARTSAFYYWILIFTKKQTAEFWVWLLTCTYTESMPTETGMVKFITAADILFRDKGVQLWQAGWHGREGRSPGDVTQETAGGWHNAHFAH